MALYRSEGILHCPSCFAMREFVPVPEAAGNDPYPPCECTVCGFVFGDCVDEVTKERRPVLDTRLRDEARQRLRDRQKLNLLLQGFRRENFEGPTDDGG